MSHALFQTLIVTTALLGALLQFAPAKSADTSQGTIVTYKHAGGAPTKSYHLKLRADEKFTVVIENTATNCFSYDFEPVLHTPAGVPVPSLGATKRPIPIVHEKQYGGYIVRIRSRPKAPACCENLTNHPDDVTLIVTVETVDFEVAFAGGFTVSGLTNPVFASRDDGSQNQIIERERSAEDQVDLGVAAFVHVYNRAWHPALPAITFGMGVGDSGRTTYHLGPFWRLGDQAFIGGGVTFGPADRLPSGLRVGDTVTAASALNNLGSRTQPGWFFSLTYTFLGGDAEDAFGKPFRTEAPSP